MQYILGPLKCFSVSDGKTNGRRDTGEASAGYSGNTESIAGNEEIEWPMIGIDLGTTNSRVAVWHEGHVEIIPNELGNRTTPSVVSFTDYGRLVGEAATNQASKNLVNTIFDAKRLIGRRFSDDIVKQDTKLWPFEVIDGTDFGKEDQPMIVVNYMEEVKRFTPEEICAMTIAKMKGVAEAFLGGTTVKNAVITVPAHFNNAQRQATKDAGAIAGFNKIYLINEPSAAAIAYSLDKEINNKCDGKKNVLVFHLGGGTFDVSLVEIEKGEISVISTSGDSHLGGTDFDNRMVCEFVKEFKQKHKKDINKNPRALARLRVASEKAKRVLSLLPKADVEIDFLFEGIDFSSTITCAHFEILNLDLFPKLTTAIDQCLHSAQITCWDVDDVVLVGGSSRVPGVQNLLGGYFLGKELCKSIHPDEAVASGTAIHAAILSGAFSRDKKIALKDIKIALKDITPSSFDVNYHPDGITKSLCDFNKAIPISWHHKMEISFGNHPYFMCEVLETENSKPDILGSYFDEKRKENIVSYVISWPPECRGTQEMIVYFEIDVNGILNVSVELRPSRDGFKIEKVDGRLSEKDIKRMIKEAESYKARDEKRKNMLQAKSALESDAYNILEQLDDAGNINNEQEEKIREDTVKLLESMEQMSDISEIKNDLSVLQNRMKFHFHDKHANLVSSSS